MLYILSLFRQREKFVEDYKKQIQASNWDADSIHVTVVENNSTDKTRELLERWAKYSRKTQVDIVGKDSNDKLHGSTTDPDRMRVLSKVANIGIEHIVQYIGKNDYFLFIENDVEYSPNLFNELKEQVDKTDGVVAPRVWTKEDVFYDIWGFRVLPEKVVDNWNSESFPPMKREWYDKNWGNDLVEIETAGTCIMCKGKVLLDDVRFSTEESIVGFCKNARKEGHKVYIDQSLDIYHK